MTWSKSKARKETSYYYVASQSNKNIHIAQVAKKGLIIQQTICRDSEELIWRRVYKFKKNLNYIDLTVLGVRSSENNNYKY